MSNHRAPKSPTARKSPSDLYALPDFPQPNVEMALYAVQAAKDIVFTPTRVNIISKQRVNEATGQVEYYFDEYQVTGKTDHGQTLSFAARTLPGSSDEITLSSVLQFTS